MIGLSVYWRGFEYFADSLRTGQSVQERVVPGGYWKYISENPEAARLFDEAMMGKAIGDDRRRYPTITPPERRNVYSAHPLGRIVR